VDYAKVCEALVSKLTERGAGVVTRARVERLDQRAGAWLAHTPAGDFRGRFPGELRRPALRPAWPSWRASAATCASCPFAAEYYQIKRSRQSLVRNLIYPVPDPRFPFSGRALHASDPPAASRPARMPCWRCRARATQDRFQRARPVRRIKLWRPVAFPAALSIDVLVRIAAQFQPANVLPLAAAAGAGNSAGRPRDRRLRRARAGHHTGRRAGAGFPIDRAPNALHVLNAPSPRPRRRWRSERRLREWWSCDWDGTKGPGKIS